MEFLLCLYFVWKTFPNYRRKILNYKKGFPLINLNSSDWTRSQIIFLLFLFITYELINWSELQTIPGSDGSSRYEFLQLINHISFSNTANWSFPWINSIPFKALVATIIWGNWSPDRLKVTMAGHFLGSLLQRAFNSI